MGTSQLLLCFSLSSSFFFAFCIVNLERMIAHLFLGYDISYILCFLSKLVLVYVFGVDAGDGLFYSSDWFRVFLFLIAILFMSIHRTARLRYQLLQYDSVQCYTYRTGRERCASYSWVERETDLDNNNIAPL
jgi:hypothetical protein